MTHGLDMVKNLAAGVLAVVVIVIFIGLFYAGVMVAGLIISLIGNMVTPTILIIGALYTIGYVLRHLDDF